MFVRTKQNLTEKQRTKKSQFEQRISKMKSRLENVKEFSDKLAPIVDLTLRELQTKIKQQELSITDVLHAFQLKAMSLFEEGNSGICEFILEADQQAEQLLQVNESQRSELYGIPVSVKELCHVRGYDSTFGLWKMCQMPADDDCILVKVLKAGGAIPFVLTATSQSAMTVSGFNPVFGDMRNPRSNDHEPGGSSTGEAVLLAQNGSPVGIGTDIAGSIRIPCAFSGLTGLKPTTQRVGCRDTRELTPNAVVHLNISVGPMGKRVEDLAMVMRSLLRPTLFRLDLTVPPMPFREDIYQGLDRSELIIGYYDNLIDPNLMQTVPSVRRVVGEAVQILRNSGHKLVKFEPHQPYTAMKLGINALSVDGGRAFGEALKGEPLNAHTKSLQQLSSIPDVLRPVVDALTRRLVGPPAAMTQLERRIPSAEQVVELLNNIRSYQTEFAKKWTDSGNLDVLICPVWAIPAPEITTSVHMINPSMIYTFLYNVVNYPAGVVPMGKVEAFDIEAATVLAKHFQGTGDAYHEQLMRLQSKSHGLPLGVQIVGKPYCEELVLRVMGELEAGSACL